MASTTVPIADLHSRSPLKRKSDLSPVIVAWVYPRLCMAGRYVFFLSAAGDIILSPLSRVMAFYSALDEVRICGGSQPPHFPNNSVIFFRLSRVGLPFEPIILDSGLSFFLFLCWARSNSLWVPLIALL